MKITKIVQALSLLCMGVGAGCTIVPTLDIPVCRENCAPYEPAVAVGRISNPDIDEASGLAGSIRHDDVLWVHNDSGDAARIFAVARDGSSLGSVTFPDLANVDWEDLTSFSLDGEAYLAIADIGDNAAIRRRPAVHIVKEPDFEGQRDQAVAWSVPFRYEDGARDCESIAIDVENRRILLLTKREVPPALYELPLRPTEAMSVAKRLVEVPLPQPTTDLMRINSRKGKYSAQPTAMDISRDGLEAVVLTYRNAFHFSRSKGESWESVFARQPRVVALPPMDNGEALSFGPMDEALYVTTEGYPAPLVRVKRNAE